MNLKSKKVLLVGWGCDNEQDTHAHQIHYLTFKKIFPEIEKFDSKKNYFQLGKDEMNRELLNYLKSKKFELIIFLMDEEEFSPETILKARELQPNARTLFVISDDDLRFSNYSRYLSILFDHSLTSQYYVPEYNKDGIKDVSFIMEYNEYKLEPLNIAKEYPVTFIGRPKADRRDIIKYLIEKGIEVYIFGWGWNKFPEFKDYYKGPLNQEDYAKITNQTKINLCLTKAGLVEEKKDLNINGKKTGRLNGRIFEIGVCKSFQIVQYFPEALELFKEDKEIVVFKSKEELLEKIKYYLDNEIKREKIAEKAYKRILNDYNREKILSAILIKILRKKRKDIRIPPVTKRLTLVKREDLPDIKNLKNKLRETDYVYFSKNEDSIYKNNFQSYSLEKTNKDISCCEYYVYSKNLGNYLRLRTFYAFKRIGKKANQLINPDQLMVKKDFFLKNIESFKKLFDNNGFELINDDNTAFVSMPLTKVKDFNSLDYEFMEKSFDMLFIKTLFSLVYQKKIFFSAYPYRLFFNSLIKGRFIIKHLFKSVFDRHNYDKLKVNKSYTQNSILKKFAKNI